MMLDYTCENLLLYSYIFFVKKQYMKEVQG